MSEYYTEDSERVYRENIFLRLSSFINNSTTIYLCVSGGADSMYMAFLMDEFVRTYSISHDMVKILHYVHNQRNIQQEENLIKKTFPQYEVCVGERNNGKATERDLRESRRNFIENEVAKSEFTSYVFTGHNLTDRIETTFLNMCRGTSLQGIINMTKKEERPYFYMEQGGMYTLIRPLLDIEKSVISIWCQRLGINFLEDLTNTLVETSKRNFIRNTVFPLVGEVAKGTGDIHQFFKSFLKLYDNLENQETIVGIDLEELEPSGEWNVRQYYRVSGIQTMSDISFLLKKVGAYRGTTYGRIKELLEFFLHSKSGRKKLNSYYFFKAHSNIYVVKSEHAFWKRKNESEKKITKKGFIEWGGLCMEIAEAYVGGVIRYPRRGDVRKGKPLSKYFITQKIPFFRRNSIPVIEKDEKVVYIYPVHETEGFI